jgi:DNA-binding NarL/FixJ family response regulator
MLSLSASSICVLASIALVVYLLRRPGGPTATQRAAFKPSPELDSKMSELRVLIHAARQEAERLEAAIETANAVALPVAGDTLAAIEGLADPAALADDAAIARVVERTPQMHPGALSDLFEQNQKTIKVARLVDEGHSTAEIARRLHMPIGEVELLVGLRSA